MIYSYQQGGCFRVWGETKGMMEAARSKVGTKVINALVAVGVSRQTCVQAFLAAVGADNTASVVALEQTINTTNDSIMSSSSYSRVLSSAIQKAVKKGKSEVLKYLLSLNGVHMHDKILAMREAARRGYVRNVQLLLESGTGPDNSALFESLLRGHAGVANILLQAGADIHQVHDKHFLTKFIQEAIKRNVSTELVTNTIFLSASAGVNFNVQDRRGNTALMTAVLSERPAPIEVIQSLIKAGASTAIQNTKGDTALMLCLNQKKLEIATVLAETALNLDVKNKSGKTVLMIAASIKEANLAMTLISKGASVNLQDPVGTSALMYAIKLAQFEQHICSSAFDCVKILIEGRSNVNIQDKNGISALMLAVSQGINFNSHTSIPVDASSSMSSNEQYLKIVQALIEANAVVDASDANGITALLFACKNQFSEAIQVLIQSKANVNSTDKKGATALMHTIRSTTTSRGVDSVKVLLENGACVDVQDQNGETALISCMRLQCKASTELATLLIKKKANVELCDFCRNSPLKVAAFSDQVDSINVLLSSGANIDAAYGEGDWDEDRVDTYQTALMTAASGGKLLALKALITAGANIHLHKKIPANNGQAIFKPTALFYAARASQLEATGALLQAGAKVDLIVASTVGFLDTSMPIDVLCAVFLNSIDELDDHLFNDESNLQKDRTRVDIIKLLLQAGASPMFQNPFGVTALALATAVGNVKCVEELLRAGAVIQNETDKIIMNPIIIAAIRGDEPMLKVLIKANADLNVPIQDSSVYKPFVCAGFGSSSKMSNYQEGRNALMLSIVHCNDASALALIRAGCNLELKDKNNETALFFAIIHKRWKVAIELVNKKANYTCLNSLAISPIDLVIAESKCPSSTDSRLSTYFDNLLQALVKNGVPPGFHQQTKNTIELEKASQAMLRVKADIYSWEFSDSDEESESENEGYGYSWFW